MLKSKKYELVPIAYILSIITASKYFTILPTMNKITRIWHGQAKAEMAGEYKRFVEDKGGWIMIILKKVRQRLLYSIITVVQGR